jgi:hypothetical protein
LLLLMKECARKGTSGGMNMVSRSISSRLIALRY